MIQEYWRGNYTGAFYTVKDGKLLKKHKRTARWVLHSTPRPDQLKNMWVTKISAQEAGEYFEAPKKKEESSYVRPSDETGIAKMPKPVEITPAPPFMVSLPKSSDGLLTIWRQK